MDDVKTKPLLWLWYICDIYFKRTHEEEQLKTFMNNFNNYKSNLKFPYEYSKSEINFLNLNLNLKKEV